MNNMYKFDFHQFIARHGEVAAQAIVENIERFAGIRREVPLTLEARWHSVLNSVETDLAQAA